MHELQKPVNFNKSVYVLLAKLRRLTSITLTSAELSIYPAFKYLRSVSKLRDQKHVQASQSCRNDWEFSYSFYKAAKSTIGLISMPVEWCAPHVLQYTVRCLKLDGISIFSRPCESAKPWYANQFILIRPTQMGDQQFAETKRRSTSYFLFSEWDHWGRSITSSRLSFLLFMLIDNINLV